MTLKPKIIPIELSRASGEIPSNNFSRKLNLVLNNGDETRISEKCPPKTSDCQGVRDPIPENCLLRYIKTIMGANEAKIPRRITIQF